VRKVKQERTEHDRMVREALEWDGIEEKKRRFSTNFFFFARIGFTSMKKLLAGYVLGNCNGTWRW
jgi:hypothetical protein